MKTITTDTHVFFYTDYMSNWWSTKDIKPQFTDPIYGLPWNNTEEAFMWYKAVFFGDDDAVVAITDHAAARRHPSEVKELGRQIVGYNDKAWTTVREGFMTYVNLLKYQQNPDLATQLKATGDRIIVEASPVDAIWGVGLDIEAAAKHAESTTFMGAAIKWPGQNLLGKSLMTVRGLL